VDLAQEPDFEIGALKVRPSVRQLEFSGRSETIEPRVLMVLMALAQRRGAVVSRDQLIEICWDGLAVSEDALNRCISKVRKLGDASDAFKLETITKVGYKLVAAPLAAVPGHPSQPSTEASGGTTRPQGFRVDRRLLLASAAVGVAAAGGLAIWRLTQATPAGPSRADELYQRAVEVGATDNPAEMAQSISFLREAVELSPGHADAWAALALAYVFSFTTNPPEKHAALAERARDAANRALELDRDNADALMALAMLLPIYQRWAEAEKNLRDVAARRPKFAPIDCVLAELLGATGRLQEAVPLAERAVALTPLISRRHYELAVYYWYAGRLEDADRTIAKAFDLWPLDISVWFGRLYTRMYGGDVRGALTMLEDEANRPRGIPPSDFELVEMSARALQSGAPADRADAVKANLAAAREGLGYARNATLFAGAVGDLDAAFEAASAYYFDRPFAVAQQYFTAQQGEYLGVRSRDTLMLFAPQLKAARADPRFEQLVSEIGLDGYWRSVGIEPDYRRLN
jgi:DNA-binding winged helix-turn-helix (wHTH) protein/tetratricopeptide (TPR) repeat protein